MASQARRRREQAARQYKPTTVELLLVALAPPCSLDGYFYFDDVQEPDDLFRLVCRGLLEREPTGASKADLLCELRDRGAFLIYLQEEPRNETPLRELVPGLIERCERLRPRHIILIKATVFGAAYKPLRLAGLPVSPVPVPFPERGQQRRFIGQERSFLEAFQRSLRQRSSP